MRRFLMEGPLPKLLLMVGKDELLTVKDCSLLGRTYLESSLDHLRILDTLYDLRYNASLFDEDGHSYTIKLTNKSNVRDAVSLVWWLRRYMVPGELDEDTACKCVAKYIVNTLDEINNSRHVEVNKFINAIAKNLNEDFATNFSYQFAVMLKDSFGRGSICLDYLTKKMVWVDDITGMAYDYLGLVSNDSNSHLFIPVHYVSLLDLASYKHVELNNTSEYINGVPDVLHLEEICLDYCRDIINNKNLSTIFDLKEDELYV